LISRRIPALALTVLAAALPLAGCGDDDSSGGDEPAAESGSVYGGGSEESDDSAQPAEDTGGAPVQAATVDISDFAYDPATITVSKGGTVEWTNGDDAPHTATAQDDSFDTGSLDKGDSAKVTLKETGTFIYICTFHPFMEGTVKVVE
jgi:plastocyanin